MSDFRRINVGLSRAKNVCVIFADLKRLAINEKWKEIIEDAISREQVFNYTETKNFWGDMK